MPARGARSAPTFNPDKPRELKRYFIDLEYLFKEANVTDDEEKIGSALRYIDTDVAELWATLEECNSVGPDYPSFKKAVRELYPDADENERYTLQDLELCIAQAKRDGMYTLGNAADYHRKFTVISHFLTEKKRLSDIETKRLYTQGFQERFWILVNNRLQLKDVDHHPADPWDISEVYAAVRFLLRGTSNAPRPETSTAISVPALTNTQPVSNPTPVSVPFKMEDFSQIIAQVTKSVVESLQLTNNRGSNGSRNPPNSGRCNFCGRDHFIRACELVSDYIRAGKCKKNIEGKIVLPSGAFVPSDIPSGLLKDRIDEWHRRNPNQLAAAQMLQTIHSHAPVSHTSGFLLSTNDQIASLEAELFALKTRRDSIAQGFAKTRAQAAKEQEKVDASAPSPAYRQQPPIHDPDITNRVYQRALDSSFPITTRELLSVSPDIRSQFREATTNDEACTEHGTPVTESHTYEHQVNDETAPKTSIFNVDVKGNVAPDIFDSYIRSLPPGQDPNNDYLVVAKDSHSLRAIEPLVANKLHIECVLDSGCQIVAMSEDVWKKLQIPLDPSIQLNMESANGSVDQSLGLARNVPFKIGDITFYFQVHVIRSPSYDILLGRPLDVVACSVISNSSDGSQQLTLHDPNSSRSTTVPTRARSRPRHPNCPQCRDAPPEDILASVFQ
ncbi:hypothetical protein BJ165DRAFT_1351674 [Panaeolus papilionaceus]|nr:hypothetical protein BJ165DRAFT_1351674 [Panaeolus papilionaceus]